MKQYLNSMHIHVPNDILNVDIVHMKNKKRSLFHIIILVPTFLSPLGAEGQRYHAVSVNGHHWYCCILGPAQKDWSMELV